MTAPSTTHTFVIADELKRRKLWTLTRTIARAYFTTPGAIIGPRRFKVEAEARQALWAALYDMGTFSTVDLGRIFHRDPSTVNAGIKRHRRRPGMAEEATI